MRQTRNRVHGGFVAEVEGQDERATVDGPRTCTCGRTDLVDIYPYLIYNMHVSLATMR